MRHAPGFGKYAFADERDAKQAGGGTRRVKGLVVAALAQAFDGNGHGDDGINGDRMRAQQAAGFVFQHAQRAAVGLIFAAQDDVAHVFGELPAHQQPLVGGWPLQAGAAGIAFVGDAVGAGRAMFADRRQAVGAGITKADHFGRAAGEATRADEAGQPAGNHAAAMRASRVLCR